MVTEEEQKEFIEAIAPLVAEIMPRYGILCNSAVIAQACLESAYGTSDKAEHKNFFGLKYRKDRVSSNSGYFIAGSKEEYQKGQMTNITASWYAFPTMRACVEGYGQFTSISAYAAGKGVKDPEAYLRGIQKAPYATSKTYVQDVLAVIRKHDLTRFDSCAKNSTKTEEKMVMHIIKNNSFRHHNTSPRPGKPEFIVVHYTASVADAPSQIAFFNRSSTRGASADFFVGWDGRIYQYNMEIPKRYSWAVGGGRQSRSGGAFFGRCLNRNQISIEMCCKSRTGAYAPSNSSAWYFTSETVEATAQLVRELMGTYNIDPAHVIRHYDVNGKYCPGIKGWNAPSGSEAAWKSFKSLISAGETKVEYKEERKPEEHKPTGSYLVRVSIKTLRIRKGPGTGYPWSRYIAPGIYTIIEEKDGQGSKSGWGRLKSGAGWISLDYARRVE